MNARGRHIMRVFVGVTLLVAATWHLAAAAYIPVKAAVAQKLLERSWQQSQKGHTQSRPWPWADTFPVARLKAPKQGADLIVLSGASGRTLAFGPGHVEGSVMPGEAGRSVIAAHRDTHFAFLKSVRVGDPLEVSLPDGREVQFVVSSIEVINSRQATIDLDVPGAALMLVTCYPFDAVRAGGELRYQVVAERVSL